MRALPSVPASHAALHPNPKASTRARHPRSQLPGVHRRVPCQYRVISQRVSNFLALSRLRTPTLRGGVVLAVLERHSPRSGAIHPLPLGKVPIPLSCLRRLRARHHVVRSSMLSNLFLPYRRAQPSLKLSMPSQIQLERAACLRFIALPLLRHRRQRRRMQTHLRHVHMGLPVLQPHHPRSRARLKLHRGHPPPLVPVPHPEDCQFTAMWHSLLPQQRRSKAQHRARFLQHISRPQPKHHQNNL